MAINCNATPTNFIDRENHDHTLMMEAYVVFGRLEEELLEQEKQAMRSAFKEAIKTNDPKLQVSYSALPLSKRGLYGKLKIHQHTWRILNLMLLLPQLPRAPPSLVVNVPGSVGVTRK